ncbi:MAG TPA: hypothetical protein VJZ27_07025, partial [Aggregatilineales bacterium]|nr:hypothetical protein [Aggregatilineales bacterium]
QGRRLLDKINEMSPAQVVQHFEGLGEISWLANWIMSDSKTRATMVKLATEWRFITSALDGNALKAMGLRPGPLMGEILLELRNARLDKRLENEEDERLYAQQRINEFSTNDQ